MAVRSVVPILNVSDVLGAIAWFEALGWEQRFVWVPPDDDGVPSFAGIGCGEVELFLCRDGQGSRGEHEAAFPFDESTGGVWMSWFLDTAAEVDAMHARAVALGLDVTLPPTTLPWGIREFHLRHPDGHTFRIGSESRP